ncbi:uncharacterized protein BDV17DRAFT_19698 [Aspergillus undulatus]|uniref:uncharacterized protein n=1 Tax=Aspergillus undulatus TaxID=1810928 RepID=UPI003CCE3FF8
MMGWLLPSLTASATATATTATTEKSTVPAPVLTTTPPTPLDLTPALQPHPPKPQPPTESDTIITVIKGFIRALNTKSTSDFDKYCVRAGGMSLCPPTPSPSPKNASPSPRFCTIGSFVEHIAKLDHEIDERIWDPEVMVYNYEHEHGYGTGSGGGGNMAAVWAPFRAKVNGVVNHVGVELFILHKVDGKWKVTGLADSCRRPTEEEKVLLL